MAKKFKNLTVDYKDMLRMSTMDRVNYARTDDGANVLAALTPQQYASLFPTYYRDKLPDIGGFSKALTSQGQQTISDSGATTGNRAGANNPTTATSSGRRSGNTSGEQLTQQPGVVPQRSRTNGSTQQQTQQRTAPNATPAWMRRLENIAPGISDPNAKAQLSSSQKTVIEQLKRGTISADSPDVAFMKELSDADLRKAGIRRTMSGGKTEYDLTPDAASKISDDQLRADLEQQRKQSGGPVQSKTPSQYFGSGVNVNDLPAGMRNNNPGNLKYASGVNWEGSMGPSQNTDQGTPQVMFNSPETGMRAAAKLAASKYNKGMKSLDQLITGPSGWTPGHPHAAQSIAKTMGIRPGDDLNLNDPAQLKKFLKALVKQEHGTQSAHYPDSLYDRGISLARGESGTNSEPNTPVTQEDINRERERRSSSQQESLAESVANQYKLPQGIDPSFKSEFDKFTPAQKQKFLESLSQRGENGVNQFNEWYKSNRSQGITGTATAGNTDIRETPSQDMGDFWRNRNPKNASLSRVDPRLMKAYAEGIKQFEAENPGYRVQVFGPAGGTRASGSTANHGIGPEGYGRAMDFAIVDRNTGKILKNFPSNSGDYASQQGSVGETSSLYTRLHAHAEIARQHYSPNSTPIRHGGGFFGSKPMDLMHGDITGGPMGGYSWEKGFTPEQMRRWNIRENVTLGDRKTISDLARQVYGSRDENGNLTKRIQFVNDPVTGRSLPQLIDIPKEQRTSQQQPISPPAAPTATPAPSASTVPGGTVGDTRQEERARTQQGQPSIVQPAPTQQPPKPEAKPAESGTVGNPTSEQPRFDQKNESLVVKPEKRVEKTEDPDAEPVKTAATGNEIKATNEQITAYPIGSLKGDNSIVVDGNQKPLFTMNTEKETATYDPRTDNVTVKPLDHKGPVPGQPQPQAINGKVPVLADGGTVEMNNVEQTDPTQLEQKQQTMEDVQAGRQEQVQQNITVQTAQNDAGPSAYNAEWQEKLKNITANPVHCPSFARSIASARFQNNGDYMSSHYNEGSISRK